VSSTLSPPAFISVDAFLETGVIESVPQPPTGAAKIHPAQYSKQLIPHLVKAVAGAPGLVFDPFAGLGWVLGEIGRQAGVTVAGCEIEQGYFDLGVVAPWVFQGDATALPFEDQSVAVFVTSVTYGNGMADSFTRSKPEPMWSRGTYEHRLDDALGQNGYRLSQNSTARYGFRKGLDMYQKLHAAAWAEAARVLYGPLVLNCKDSIHTVTSKGVKSKVLFECTRWHVATLESLGFRVVSTEKVECPGLRFGKNGAQRVTHEDIVVLNSPSMH
jgi:hypothetical protein